MLSTPERASIIRFAFPDSMSLVKEHRTDSSSRTLSTFRQQIARMQHSQRQLPNTATRAEPWILPTPTRRLVEPIGIEPMTSSLQSWRSPS